MRNKKILEIGVPEEHAELASTLMQDAKLRGLKKKQARKEILDVLKNPGEHLEHMHFAPLAKLLYQDGFEIELIAAEKSVPWKQWGIDLEEIAVQQMRNACKLPIAVQGALMPDAHMGYGLPIGGVLATNNAVIPYAVGVDIACRVKMTVLDMPAESIETDKKHLIDAIQEKTRFGIGAAFKKPHDHKVMSQDWGFSPVTRQIKSKAEKQLGTSGSGNHFVEFGLLEFSEDHLGLKAGTYLALLSHSGSRGAGSNIAEYYSSLAMRMRPGLPKELKHLAWLDLDTQEGLEYWKAMELMGMYASANHEIIHREIAQALGTSVLLDIENHHNYAWKEKHNGQDLIVHRKGATPANKGDIGIIPGSMASSTYVVQGKGEPSSLNSASHGAGRVMSRTKAKKTFRWSEVKNILDRNQITLISAGLDEVPGVYKDIDLVMSEQQDLVDILARFTPRIVKMAPHGERPED